MLNDAVEFASFYSVLMDYSKGFRSRFFPSRREDTTEKKKKGEKRAKTGAKRQEVMRAKEKLT